MSKALWNMAPERRTEPETARLRQVPPVTAVGYKYVPVEVCIVRCRRIEVVTRVVIMARLL